MRAGNTYRSLNVSMAKSDSAKARQHRLALKLRENLRRRKAEAPLAPNEPAPRRDDDKTGPKR